MDETLQDAHRDAAKDLDHSLDRLRSARTYRRFYFIWLFCSILLISLLAYSTVIALWRDQPTMTRYVGLIAVLVSAVAAATVLIRTRPQLVDLNFNTRELLHKKQKLASRLELESVESLRIYREASLDLVEQYRRRATANRRVHNIFQGIIIVLSIVVSTLTALSGEIPDARWFATVLSALVGISAGLTGYFKFRERGFNLQSTADDIEKHYNAVQFRLDEYARDADEIDRLRQFAQYVEHIKEEQRKRELQLEQSPGPKEDRG
jgi:hypothetical protein